MYGFFPSRRIFFFFFFFLQTPFPTHELGEGQRRKGKGKEREKWKGKWVEWSVLGWDRFGVKYLGRYVGLGSKVRRVAEGAHDMHKWCYGKRDEKEKGGF